MNQEKIGKFIAKCRKEKKMTQLELADKLGVSDKSVGNWENARCMPDLSLFKPLCDELDISINELISGEKIKKDDYQEKADENIINTISYANKKVNDKNNLMVIILICFGVFLSLIAMAIFPSESSWGSIYAIIGGIISLVGIDKFAKKLTFFKRILCNLGYFFSFIFILLLIDCVGVINFSSST